MEHNIEPNRIESARLPLLLFVCSLSQYDVAFVSVFVSFFLGPYVTTVTIRYDTIRYDTIYLHSSRSVLFRLVHPILFVSRRRKGIDLAPQGIKHRSHLSGHRPPIPFVVVVFQDHNHKRRRTRRLCDLRLRLSR